MPILQAIVKESPDGEVSVAPLSSEVVISMYRFYAENHRGMCVPGLTPLKLVFQKVDQVQLISFNLYGFKKLLYRITYEIINRV